MRPRTWLTAATFAALLLASATALAGELKIGTEPLDVDDAGNLTKTGREKAVAEIESAVPGDELWRFSVWAQLDKPAAGPLYLEFYRDHDGKKLMAHRVEVPDFPGEKFFSMDVEISRSEGGFKSGETLEVAFVQTVGGKDVKKAKGTVKLLASSKPLPTKPADSASDVERDREHDEKVSEEETRSPDSPAAPSSSDPPPVESGDKKGCAVTPVAPAPWLALVALGATRRRRS